LEIEIPSEKVKNPQGQNSARDENGPGTLGPDDASVQKTRYEDEIDDFCECDHGKWIDETGAVHSGVVIVFAIELYCELTAKSCRFENFMVDFHLEN
jgi:hypothetical protein